jgi:signal peptidase II
MTTLARPLLQKRAIAFALAALVFAVDQAAKWAVLGPLDLANVGQIVFAPIFALTFTMNTGVSLGLLTAGSDAQRWMLVALTAVIAIAVLVWMLRERRMFDLNSLALVLGGALGNIYDRVTHGYVIDFLDLHFGSFRPFLVFNPADAAITIGVLLVLARSFLSGEKRPDPEIEAAETAAET